mgnify:CR=1 FL=1
MNQKIKALRAKHKAADKFGVGEIVVWNSRTGPTEAEYRGEMWGSDGFTKEATIIVRPPDKPFYQITIPLSQLQKKSLDVKDSKALESYRGFRIEKYEGIQMGHRTNRSGNSRVGIGTSRNYSGYQLFYPDSDGSKVVDTLKEAKQYIDSYLS